MAYRVLARTWRPQRFADLLGQETVVQTLRNALASGSFGQAYLFSGLRGVGKTTAARLLAKAVNCTDGPTAEPCGECDSCRDITGGSSLDVVEIDGASNRGIDDVRELRELVRVFPTRDRYRVIIVDEVHMLTREAFNALLKTIEEPPPYILWIFATTERSKVPETILSRCQQLEFRPVGADLIRRHLETIAAAEEFSLTPSAAASIAAAADGSVRDALSLLDQLRAFAAGEVDDEAVATVLGVPPLEQMVGLLTALTDGRIADGLRLLRELLAGGQDPTVLYQELGRILRVLLYLAVDPELDPTLSDQHRARLQPVAEALGGDAVSRMLGLWAEQAALLRDAGNRDLALEVAAVRLARWPSVRKIEAWLAGDPPPPAPASEGDGRTGSGPPTPTSGATASGSLGGSRDDGTDSAAAAESPASEVTSIPDAGRDDLEQRVASDPGVALATRILGGEVVAVRRDGGES